MSFYNFAFVLTQNFHAVLFSQETDIGRHVNRLRKHSSNDVRRLVKHLVRYSHVKITGISFVFAATVDLIFAFVKEMEGYSG